MLYVRQLNIPMCPEPRCIMVIDRRMQAIASRKGLEAGSIVEKVVAVIYDV